MMWFYCSGIIILSCLLVNADYKKDCLVDEFKTIEYWTGEEVTFFAYVLDNDVVIIKLTYEFLDAANFYTTFYFSPSTNLSQRIETKYGEENIYDLKPMEKENDWVQFNISSHTMGSIELKCEPDTHEIIHINQTKHTFKDLIIRASNISFCEERKLEVVKEDHKTIPLGKDIEHKLFSLKFQSPYNVIPYLRLLDYVVYEIPLPLGEYSLTIERTNNTWYTEKDKVIKFGVSQNVTTIDIFCKEGNFSVSVYFGIKSPASAMITSKPITKEDSCPSCKDKLYLSTLTPALVIFILCTIIVGVGFKAQSFLSRINKINFSSKCNEYQQARQTDGNQPMA